jgi:hypothetical protein
MAHQENRREFLQKSLLMLGSLPVVGVILNACTKKEEAAAPAAPAAAAGGLKAISEDDPVAQSLGYKADATKVDVQKYPKRAGAEGAKQFCSGCQFFSAAEGELGKCQLFPNGLVAKNGWCNSWQAKQG